jgi:hypothetical protein
MLVLAPLSNVGYQLFDPAIRGAIPYYENSYYLLFVLSPWIALALFSSGLFLLFPKASRRGWFLVIPVTAAICKVIWLFTITSNEEFHRIVPLYFLFPAAAIAFIWLFLLDWLIHRKYHRKDALHARMDGLFMANLPADDKIRHLRTTWTDLKNFDKEY